MAKRARVSHKKRKPSNSRKVKAPRQALASSPLTTKVIESVSDLSALIPKAPIGSMSILSQCAGSFDPAHHGEDLSEFELLVRAELTKADEKHPTPIRSPHEAYGVIKEEFDEFWAEVMRDNKRDQLHELVQTAAMCAKAARLYVK